MNSPLTPKIQNSSERPVVSRPNQGLWILVILFGFLTLSFPLSEWFGPSSRPIPTRADYWAEFFLICMVGIPTLVGARWLIRCRVVASSAGITFVDFFRSSFHTWREIEDYELRFPTKQVPAKQGVSQVSHPVPHLKIGGKWHMLPLGNIYTRVPELAQKIVMEAKWSESQEWQPCAARDTATWPQTFVYREIPPWKYWGSALLFAVWMIVLICYTRKPELACILIPYGLLLLKMSSVHVPSTIQLGQQIIATQEGLSYMIDGAEIFLAWDEIETYYLIPPPGSLQLKICVVEGGGKQIEFNSLISDADVLKNLIEVRAQNVGDSGWRYLHGADAEVLGGAASLWQDGKLGVGPQIHHYRTRATRIFLVFGFFGVGLMVIGGALALTSGRDNSLADWAVPLLMLLLFVGLTLNGLLAYRFAFVQCRENGLVLHNVRGEKTIPWPEIESIGTTSYWYIVKSQKSNLRFSVLVADAIGLKDRIQRMSGQEIKSL